MVLGQADLDGFVDSHVNTTVEFEENFKAIKSKRKEADKLPDVIKVAWARAFANVFDRFSS